MNKKLINYEALEIYIKQWEQIMSNLDIEEKILVIKFISQRLNSEKAKQRMDDLQHTNKLMAFAHKMMDKHPDNNKGEV